MTQIRKPIQKEGKKKLLNKLTLLLHSAAINWKSFFKVSKLNRTVRSLSFTVGLERNSVCIWYKKIAYKK